MFSLAFLLLLCFTVTICELAISEGNPVEGISNNSTNIPHGGPRRFRMLMPAKDPTERSDRWVAGIVKLVLAVLILLLIVLGPPDLRQWPSSGFFLLVVVIVFANPIRPQQEPAFNCYYVVKSGYLNMYLGLPRPQCRFRFNLSNCSRAILGDVRHPEEMRLQLHTPWGWTFSVPPLEDMEEFVAAVADELPVEIERQVAPTRLPLSHVIVVGAILLTFCLISFLGLSFMLH